MTAKTQDVPDGPPWTPLLQDYSTNQRHSAYHKGINRDFADDVAYCNLKLRK
jgi:hypothetical protein